MAEPKIIYEDTAVGGTELTTGATAEDRQSWCRVPDILKENQPPRTATLEQDYWILGKDFHFFPDTPEAIDWGWWTGSMSDAEGNFETPPVLVLDMEGYFTSVGLTFTFDPYGPTWPTKMRVAWYRDNELLTVKDFSPNSYQYSAIETVHLYNKVVITFSQMSQGYRYLKLQRAVYGIIRTFGKDEFSAAAFYQAISMISDELEISDLVFNLRNTSDVPFSFQRKQQLAVYHGNKLLGLRFITKAEQLGANYYKLTAQDLLGILTDSGDHNGGVYDGEYAEDVIADILGDAVPYTIEEGLKKVPIKGWLPMSSRINNLTYVLFAIGATASTANVREIRIFKPQGFDGIVAPVSLAGRSMTGPRLTTDKVLTGVQVTEHSFTKGTDRVEEFKGTLEGTKTVTFSEPVWDLTITGGAIEEWGANYAVIHGDGGEAVLTGTKYNHTTQLLTRDNPLVEHGTPPKVKKCPDAYLVGPHNSAEVLERYYNYHLRNQTVDTRFVLADEDDLGAVVQLEKDFHGDKRGHLVSIDLTLSRKLVADAKVLLEVEEV